jgi:hypothetical protein
MITASDLLPYFLIHAGGVSVSPFGAQATNGPTVTAVDDR